MCCFGPWTWTCRLHVALRSCGLRHVVGSRSSQFRMLCLIHCMRYSAFARTHAHIAPHRAAQYYSIVPTSAPNHAGGSSRLAQRLAGWQARRRAGTQDAGKQACVHLVQGLARPLHVCVCVCVCMCVRARAHACMRQRAHVHRPMCTCANERARACLCLRWHVLDRLRIRALLSLCVWR